jgi:hypothetical protein
VEEAEPQRLPVPEPLLREQARSQPKEPVPPVPHQEPPPECSPEQVPPVPLSTHPQWV